MKEYKTPELEVIDQMIEGVYAGSGTIPPETDSVEAPCWRVSIQKDQANAGGYATFRVNGEHTRAVTHISKGIKIQLVANMNVSSAEFENVSAQCSGTSIIITRNQHANAYYSGDNFNSLLKVWPSDGNNLEALDVSVVSWGCDKTENVQGGMD